MVVLQAEQLHKRYGDVQAVSGLSLEVRRGEIFGFLGPNGAGKTTSIRMMCGLLPPDQGTVRIHGSPIQAGNREGLRRVGLCPQNIVVWETLTCREQLEFMARMYGVDRASAQKNSRELLETLGLAEKADRLAKTLSGGMQRRLNIALALVHDPEIVFLDEPQAGLDPQSRVLVREIIRKLAQRATVIVTTHDMEEAEKLSHRVCIIDRGKVLVMDTVENVKNLPGEGDLIEIEIDREIPQELSRRIAALYDDGAGFTLKERSIHLVSGDAAGRLLQILQWIKELGMKTENLRLRKKNLEDVFIHLTGRGLRE